MDIEAVREYCLSLPLTSEDMAFGDDLLLFRVCEKIFACLSLAGDGYLALKCNPDYAIQLRDSYPDIQPAYHWNKKYWNQVNLHGILKNDFIQHLISHSYAEVVKNFQKRLKLNFLR